MYYLPHQKLLLLHRRPLLHIPRNVGPGDDLDMEAFSLHYVPCDGMICTRIPTDDETYQRD
jgi:hypothetical protein